jgi:predicted PurR-regulated permease PerM
MPDAAPERVSFYRPVHQGVLVVFATVGVVGALAAIYSVHLILLGTLIGIGIGTLIAPLAEKVRARYKIPRVITAILLLFIGYGAFIAVGYFLGAMISDEIVPLMRRLPELTRGLEERFGQLAHAHPWLGISTEKADFQKYLNGAAGAVFEGVKFGANAVAGAVFIFFVALYLAIRPREYLDGLISALPSHRREGTRQVLENCGQSLRHWFWAQLSAMRGFWLRSC